jgi:general stress protein CsbA
MLSRILSEVFVGVLVAGIVTAVMIPAARQLGYAPGAWMAWVALAGSIAACIVVGERRSRRRNASGSS